MSQGNESALERITKVKLPFDRRHTDDSKNYGIHGLDVWFILKGPKGAVQFLVSFGIYLPHLYPEYDRKFRPGALEPKITGYDVGYHGKEPMYEGQLPRACDILGGDCYSDGSALAAVDWAEEIFSVKGDHPEKLLWEKLEQEYVERFGEALSQESGEA